MHCPEKYKAMGSFQSYHQSLKVAPFLTIFIGGNHEAVNSLRESYFGGWMAKNIYYLGQAGSIFVKKGTTKIRITGFSGIYNHQDFKYVTKIEKYPLKGKDKIISYHLKQLEVYRVELLARLCQLKK
jgi:lariat debranching enzyme